MGELALRFEQDVVMRGGFEHDWFTAQIARWEGLLQPLVGRSVKLLELGSFEGLSACFVLWYLPDAHLTCVDSFQGWFATPDLEERFDRNVALVDASRVRKLVGTTHAVLPRLVSEADRFDFIYVDASHHALDVLADAALSWQLLKPGGLMLFDDYELDHGDPLLTPGVAIDAFQTVVARVSEVVLNKGQFALRKIR